MGLVDSDSISQKYENANAKMIDGNREMNLVHRWKEYCLNLK